MRNTIHGYQRMPTVFPLVVAAFLFGAAESAAQDPPATDVYLAALKIVDGRAMPGAPINITRRVGYDNQPHFLGAGDRLLYTSIEEDQADIWIYDLETRERRRLTATPESEYSPTPIPGEDAISVVRVEADGTQRLWRFPLGDGEPDLLLPKVQPVGYHAWSGSRDLVLFVLGEPPTLQHATRGDGTGKVLAENIGRALHRVPGSDSVGFIHKESEAKWTIRTVDPATGELGTLLETLSGREDFAFSPSGKLWMGDGSALYVADPKGGDGWRQVVDFTEHKVTEITRIAIHPEEEWIAFVAVPQK